MFFENKLRIWGHWPPLHGQAVHRRLGDSDGGGHGNQGGDQSEGSREGGLCASYSRSDRVVHCCCRSLAQVTVVSKGVSKVSFESHVFALASHAAALRSLPVIIAFKVN